MAQQPKKLCYRTYPSPCSPVFAQRWVGWVGWYRFSLWPRALVTGLLSQERNLHQRGFSKGRYIGQQLLGQISRMFSSRQSILDRAGLPTVIQLGTIALMAHLGQRSSFSLLSGLDVSRLEPHRLGLSPTRILASPIIGLSSTDWPVSRPFTRSPGQREGAEQDFQPLKSDW